MLEDRQNQNRKTILILDKTCFYPTSGGQMHDLGKIIIKGENFDVVQVEKVGKCVLHYLNREIEDSVKGLEVEGFIDKE